MCSRGAATPGFVPSTKRGSPAVPSRKPSLEALCWAVWTRLPRDCPRRHGLREASIPALGPHPCRVPAGRWLTMGLVEVEIRWYSALKKKGVLTQGTAWMNPEDVIAISRSEQDQQCTIPPPGGA